MCCAYGSAVITTDIIVDHEKAVCVNKDVNFFMRQSLHCQYLQLELLFLPPLYSSSWDTSGVKFWSILYSKVCTSHYSIVIIGYMFLKWHTYFLLTPVIFGYAKFYSILTITGFILVKSALLKRVHHLVCVMQYHDCNEISASTTFTFMSITSWSTL